MTQAEREPLQGRSTTGLHTAPGRLATGLQLARSRAPAIRAALLIALLLFVLAFLRDVQHGLEREHTLEREHAP